MIQNHVHMPAGSLGQPGFPLAASETTCSGKQAQAPARGDQVDGDRPAATVPPPPTSVLGIDTWELAGFRPLKVPGEGVATKLARAFGAVRDGGPIHASRGACGVLLAEQPVAAAREQRVLAMAKATRDAVKAYAMAREGAQLRGDARWFAQAAKGNEPLLVVSPGQLGLLAGHVSTVAVAQGDPSCGYAQGKGLVVEAERFLQDDGRTPTATAAHELLSTFIHPEWHSMLSLIAEPAGKSVRELEAMLHQHIMGQPCKFPGDMDALVRAMVRGDEVDCIRALFPPRLAERLQARALIARERTRESLPAAAQRARERPVGEDLLQLVAEALASASQQTPRAKVLQSLLGKDARTSLLASVAPSGTDMPARVWAAYAALRANEAVQAVVGRIPGSFDLMGGDEPVRLVLGPPDELAPFPRGAATDAKYTEAIALMQHVRSAELAEASALLAAETRGRMKQQLHALGVQPETAAQGGKRKNDVRPGVRIDLSDGPPTWDSVFRAVVNAYHARLGSPEGAGQAKQDRTAIPPAKLVLDPAALEAFQRSRKARRDAGDTTATELPVRKASAEEQRQMAEQIREMMGRI